MLGETTGASLVLQNGSLGALSRSSRPGPIMNLSELVDDGSTRSLPTVDAEEPDATSRPKNCWECRSGSTDRRLSARRRFEERAGGHQARPGFEAHRGPGF